MHTAAHMVVLRWSLCRNVRSGSSSGGRPARKSGFQQLSVAVRMYRMALVNAAHARRRCAAPRRTPPRHYQCRAAPRRTCQRRPGNC
eukprot:2114462-Pleurochrysis_carterae.AAC.2